MRETTYKMTCGCEVGYDGRKRTRHGWVCPNHADGVTKFKIILCEDCGARVEADPQSSAVKRCTECQAEYAANRGRAKSKWAAEMRAASENAWDCKHRGTCLTKAFSRTNRDYLPCLNCPMYTAGLD